MHTMLNFSFFVGLIDYVAPENTTAVDRASSLAAEISKNGPQSLSILILPTNHIILAPLALRAAKQAISRSEDLSLETGD